jgi:hypothetical protein
MHTISGINEKTPFHKKHKKKLFLSETTGYPLLFVPEIASLGETSNY